MSFKYFVGLPKNNNAEITFFLLVMLFFEDK